VIDIDTRPRVKENGNFDNLKEISEISEISVIDNNNIFIDTRPREVNNAEILVILR
jgi:hypothetical protein